MGDARILCVCAPEHRPGHARLVGIEHVSIEDRGAVLAALDGFAQGLDFADALHLARSSRAAAFLTFDRRLAKRAKSLSVTPPVEILG
jgi:predicted nucleic acid-binding protein